jgi:hypothetical protein
MATFDEDKTGQPTGITHHPIEDEQARQEQVPPRGEAKDGSTPTPEPGSTKAHRLSREPGPEGDPSTAEGSFQGKGGKGGQSGGSRAGLLATRKVKKTPGAGPGSG